MKHGKDCCLKHKILAALLFFIFASPAVFSIVQGILGGLVTVASASGLPTTAGLIIHAVVFTLALSALKRRNGGCGWKNKGGWNKGYARFQ